MFGLLIPCGGGKPIVLRKGHLLVGRRLEYASELENLPPESELHCELVHDEQGWTVRTFHGARGIRVRVNGTRVETRRLASGDTLFLAGRRYRIEYSQTDERLPGSTPSPADADSAAFGDGFDVPRGMLIPQGEGHRVPLVKPSIVIGSAGDCDLVLPGLTVAPHHCRLSFDDGWWQVTDTSHGLGVRVGHVPVKEHWLYPGDILMVAMFRYELQYPVGAAVTADVSH